MRIPRFVQTRRSLRLILLSALVLWSSIQVKTSVDGRPLGGQQASASVAGRPLYKPQEIAKLGQTRVEEKLMVRALIGSRPPRCETRCITCGHCEPVQVPAVPEEMRGMRKFKAATNGGGGDFASNYKPMKWKCKCGDTIFNP